VIAKRMRPVNMDTVFPGFSVPSYTGVMA